MIELFVIAWIVIGLLVLLWAQMKVVDYGGRIEPWAMPVLVLLWPGSFLVVWVAFWIYAAESGGP